MCIYSLENNIQFYKVYIQMEEGGEGERWRERERERERERDVGKEKESSVHVRVKPVVAVVYLTRAHHVGW